jgi:serine/threonine-protein kinase ATR
MVAKVINENTAMVNELLKLCDFPIKDKDDSSKLSMKKNFPNLNRLVPSCLIIPLQESLIASLPPTSAAADSIHEPFPVNLPRFSSESCGW